MILTVKIREKSFGDKILMTDVDFSIDDGEKIGLIGRNGLGKSTLLNLISGEDKDFSGEINLRAGKILVKTAQEHTFFDEKNSQNFAEKNAQSSNKKIPQNSQISQNSNKIPRDISLLNYILRGLPEFENLQKILQNFAQNQNPKIHEIAKYNDAIERFSALNYWNIENEISEELETFGLQNFAQNPFKNLSGGQKRLAEIVKIMHAGAHLALIDEPTNHMDFRAKTQFIDFAKTSKMAMLIITHDRDVLKIVDKIIEIKDGKSEIFRGNYDDYLRQNRDKTATNMNDFENVRRQIENLKKRISYARARKSGWTGTADKRNPFVVMENRALKELEILSKVEKPSFWIDEKSRENLGLKEEKNYAKFRAKNIRLDVSKNDSRSSSVLISVRNLALGFSGLRDFSAFNSADFSNSNSADFGEKILFENLNFDLREREKLEIRGRNGAGKTTLIRAILREIFAKNSAKNNLNSAKNNLKNLNSAKKLSENLENLTEDFAEKNVEDSREKFAKNTELNTKFIRANKIKNGENSRNLRESFLTIFDGEIETNSKIRVGIYEQEIGEKFLDFSLYDAIEKMYLDENLEISDAKIRRLLSDYLFSQSDADVKISRLSGGQKARFQLISMLKNSPNLLILDEPTNHLDLPSIEELENALAKFDGAAIYVSHDSYFRAKLGGKIVNLE